MSYIKKKSYPACNLLYRYITHILVKWIVSDLYKTQNPALSSLMRMLRSTLKKNAVRWMFIRLAWSRYFNSNDNLSLIIIERGLKNCMFALLLDTPLALSIVIIVINLLATYTQSPLLFRRLWLLYTMIFIIYYLENIFPYLSREL